MRKCTPAESNYSSLKGECKAVIYGLEKFDKFLMMTSHFYLITDSSALKYLMTLKTSTKLFARWATHIFQYPCHIIHRSGILNINSDVLSRSTDLMDDFQNSDLQYENIHSISLIFSPLTHPFTLQEISAAQRQDRVLSETHQWLTDQAVDFTQLYDAELLDMKD